MGRTRTINKHLPRRMQLKGGGYYYVYRRDGKDVWEGLGRDYGAALFKWAEADLIYALLYSTVKLLFRLGVPHSWNTP